MLFRSFTWLVGMPSSIQGQVRTQIHDIEVEDEAFATLEYPNGAHGYLYAGVNDAPQVTRLELCGDKGRILIESTDWREEGVKFWEIKPSLSTFTVESKEMWAAPEAKLVDVPLPKRDQGHIAVTRNFCRAILFGEKLVTPGAEGIWSLELANAMILSSCRKKTVRLPVKRTEYEQLLDELKAKSKPKRRVRDQRMTDTAFTGKKK